MCSYIILNTLALLSFFEMSNLLKLLAILNKNINIRKRIRNNFYKMSRQVFSVFGYCFGWANVSGGQLFQKA